MHAESQTSISPSTRGLNGYNGAATFLKNNPLSSWSVIVGPVPISAQAIGAGVVGGRLSWNAENTNGGFCEQGGAALLEQDLRLFAGMDVFAQVGAGVGGLAAVGAEGRVRLFDVGAEHFNRYSAALDYGYATDGETWESVLQRIGCNANQLLNREPVEDACAALLGQLCDEQNFQIVDKLLRLTHEDEWRVNTELLGGSLSVYVELLFKRFSKQLFSWRGLKWSGFRAHRGVEAEEEFFGMSSMAGAEDSLAAFPDAVVDILAWPFNQEDGGGTGEPSPLCPADQ